MPRRLAGFVYPVASIVALLAVTSFWTLGPLLPVEMAKWATLPVVLLGVMLVIVLAVHAPLFRAVLTSRMFAFLGLISFSLYLVHEPIVIAVSQFVGRATPSVLVGVPVALGVAVAFWWAVERPSHRLARRVRDDVRTHERRAAHVPPALAESETSQVSDAHPRNERVPA
jgi:peptidoglycan/LPS O-acetylase OafA/YrhL